MRTASNGAQQAKTAGFLGSNNTDGMNKDRKKMTLNTLQFENGLQLRTFSVPWGNCVEVMLLDDKGDALQRGMTDRGQLLPMAWYPALEEAIGEGKIFDLSTLEKFFDQMGKEPV